MKAKVGDFLVVKGTTVEMSDQRGVITARQMVRRRMWSGG
jgi:hypothetical protein